MWGYVLWRHTTAFKQPLCVMVIRQKSCRIMQRASRAVTHKYWTYSSKGMADYTLFMVQRRTLGSMTFSSSTSLKKIWHISFHAFKDSAINQCWSKCGEGLNTFSCFVLLIHNSNFVRNHTKLHRCALPTPHESPRASTTGWSPS
jgi:hypothetical protein